MIVVKRRDDRGTDYTSPHGIPVDLLDRSLIIRTVNYSIKEIITILSIRAVTEGVELQDEALAELGTIGARTSLRYCEQLLAPARILAETYGRKVIQYPLERESGALNAQGERHKGGGRSLPRLEAVGEEADGQQGKVPAVTCLLGKRPKRVKEHATTYPP